MRTDIIYFRSNQIISPEKKISSKFPIEEYEKCMNFFREAQNREVDGDIVKASELYERSLSIRKSRGKICSLVTNFCFS